MERCCHHGAQQPPYLANKTAQVMSLAFAKLYPAELSDFFPNLITAGPSIFLRTLSQIDGEVVNRRIHHTKVKIITRLIWLGPVLNTNVFDDSAGYQLKIFLARVGSKYAVKGWDAREGRRALGGLLEPNFKPGFGTKNKYWYWKFVHRGRRTVRRMDRHKLGELFQFINGGDGYRCS